MSNETQTIQPANSNVAAVPRNPGDVAAEAASDAVSDEKFNAIASPNISSAQLKEAASTMPSGQATNAKLIMRDRDTFNYAHTPADVRKAAVERAGVRIGQILDVTFDGTSKRNLSRTFREHAEERLHHRV